MTDQSGGAEAEADGDVRTADATREAPGDQPPEAGPEADGDVCTADATVWADAALEPNGGWRPDSSRDAYVLQDTLGIRTTVTRHPAGGDGRRDVGDDTVENPSVDDRGRTGELDVLDDLDVTTEVGGLEAGTVPERPGERPDGPAEQVGGQVAGEVDREVGGVAAAVEDDGDGPGGVGARADRTRAERTREEFLAVHRRLVTSAWQVASEFFAGSPRVDDLAADAVDEALVHSIARWERVRRRGNPVGSVALATLDACRTMVRKGRWFGDPPRDPTVESGAPRQRPPGPDDRSPVAAALEKLRTREREVLVLSVWAGLSESDIALCLDLSSSKVTDAALHGMAKLRSLLHDAEHAEADDGDIPADDAAEDSDDDRVGAED